MENIARLLRFKIKARRPKRPASILIVSGESQKRREVAKKLSKRYGFVYVSVLDLLKEQIAKNTEVGRLALSKMQRDELIEDNIINGLVQSRLSMVDCQLQGFVLEGYPQTLVQASTLKDPYIQPTMIVLFDGGKPLSTDILKELSENHDKIISKLGSSSEEVAFENICFSL